MAYNEKTSRGNDDKCYQRSLHIFDSASAIQNGNGYTIRYAHSLNKIVSYRVTGILLDGISTVGPTTPYYLIYCDLVRGMSTGHKNGSPESIVACIFNTSSSARISWNYPMCEFTEIQIDSFTDINIYAKDAAGAKLLSPARIVITFEFVHDFYK